MSESTVSSLPATANPLLTRSPLPYQLPPFASIREEHFLPAFEQGMTAHLQEIEAIVRQPEPPDLNNTLIALELAGELLGRVTRVFSILTTGNSTPGLDRLEAQIAPRLAAHQDAVLLNPTLFQRIKSLHDRRDRLGLDAESRHLLERYHRDFVRAGARLSPADQASLKTINGEIASLQIRFKQNVLKETNASGIWVETREELAGLAPQAIEAAAAAARAAGRNGQYFLRLTNTSGQPPLASLAQRGTRQRLMAASLARGSRGGEFDNREIVTRIARLRAERATLLGYANHAAYQLELQTAQSVASVNQLLAQLGPPAVANARREAAAIQALINAGAHPHLLEACDWDFYSEQVRQADYSFNEGDLRPYYEAERVLHDGVFFASTRLFGITYRARPDLQGYSPDMSVYEVFNEDGSPLSLLLIDLYARPNKKGGAWMNAYVPQNGLTGAMPVIAIHLNVPKPPDGEPTLLTHDEVKTYFHEYGHALHGMFSTVRYPKFGGTNVPRDFVEFPSQVYEMWRNWPEVLGHFARHHRTGEAIPPALLAKLAAAGKFNQGYETLELVAANVIDQAWHQLTAAAVPAPEDVAAFETAALHRAGLDFAPVPPRYRSTYYSHIFASDAYSAGYYSYFWSEVLDAHAVEWFKVQGGLTRANGERLRTTVLARGGSADALGLYRDFTGEAASLQPFLVRRGLTASAA